MTTTSTPARERVAAALRYAAAGWPVFPVHWTTEDGCSCGQHDCHSRGKHPLTRHGLHNATTGRDTITAWWTRWPHANVAIATGRPGPDVLDFDVKGGAPGAATLERLRTVGLLAGAFGVVTTWSGGWHLYYPGSEQGNGSLRGRGLDFRSRGGYVLAPPSSIDGRAYVLTDGRSPLGEGVTGVDFGQLRRYLDPPAALSVRTGTGVDYRALVDHVARQGEGNRNSALFWAACRAAAAGAADYIFAELLAAAVSTGLPERAAAATIASARRRNGGGA